MGFHWVFRVCPSTKGQIGLFYKRKILYRYSITRRCVLFEFCCGLNPLHQWGWYREAADWCGTQCLHNRDAEGGIAGLALLSVHWQGACARGTVGSRGIWTSAQARYPWHWGGVCGGRWQDRSCSCDQGRVTKPIWYLHIAEEIR